MTQELQTKERRDRLILLRIVVGFFYFGMIQNVVDIVFNDYKHEWILWIKYVGLLVACAALFLRYRWGYFLFLAVVLFNASAFAIIIPENRPILLFGLIGPLIMSAVVLPKWKQLR